MVFSESVKQINVPPALVASPPAGGSARSAQRRNRDFVHRMRAIAALRHAGCVVEPTFKDAQGAQLPEREEMVLRDEVERAIRELADGRAAHAQRTIAELDALRKSDAEQVNDLLKLAYESHARGVRSRDVLDALLDTFERWLNLDGVARVDLLFNRVDLDRAPDSLGVLLLATTRLTRAHFAHRDAFVERLSRWLIGRSGRTEQDVDTLLRGLRE